ncbi:hypothetical protein KGQ72_00395 [Patescibacteria group bacterium]|nr:hypothetical protein [Patescibacteria group bacterium]
MGRAFEREIFMGTLQDALHTAGVASEKQVCELQAEIQLRAEVEAAQRLKPTKEKEKRLGILRETSSPDTFRREARKLLLQWPDLVQELLNIAHAQGMHQKKDKGGTRLIANLYQVRESLQQAGLSDEAREALVSKLLPKK